MFGIEIRQWAIELIGGNDRARSNRAVDVQLVNSAELLAVRRGGGVLKNTTHFPCVVEKQKLPGVASLFVERKVHLEADH